MRSVVFFLPHALASSLAAQNAGPPIAITNVTVVDVAGGVLRPGQTVIVEGGRIRSATASARATVPRTAKVLDGTGKFLIPGLWDMHAHIAKTGERGLAAYVENGVTSVRDMGGEFALVKPWKAEIDAGTRIGPHIVSAGPILESASNYARQVREGGVEPFVRTRVPVATPADAPRVIDSLVALGAQFVKIRTISSPETYDAIAREAARHHLKLTGHADILPFQRLIDAGQASLEHSYYPQLRGTTPEQRRALFDAMVGRGMVVVPTLVVGRNSLMVPRDSGAAILADTLGTVDPRMRDVQGYLITDWREQFEERQGLTPEIVRGILVPALAILREMHAAGVQILPGTDAAVVFIFAGSSVHDELGLLVSDVGLTPAEALRAGTLLPARFFGLDGQMGTIAAGQRADLVLLGANPLADIRNTRRIEAVIVQGRLVRP
jgi:imidazolonepropionase-like amidohydrolase